MDVLSILGGKLVETVTRTAVVFQGGGAYGAYEYGAFQALWEANIRPDVVTGVSIGAVNAAVVAGCRNNDPPKALTELWRHLTVASMPFLPDGLHQLLTAPYNPGMYTVNPELFLNPLGVTSYSHTALLEETLDELIDWDKLNTAEDRMKLAVTALDVKTGKLTVFRNFTTDDEESLQDVVGPPLTAKHIVASGSLPPAFPMTQIEGKHYWDGGLFSNTPLKPSFRALQAIDDPDEEKVRRRIIVLALFPPEGEIPRNLAEVDSRKTDVAYLCKTDFDVKLYEKIDAFRAFARKAAEICTPEQIDAFKKVSPGFERLLRYKPIHELLRINLDEPEASWPSTSLLPGADFTEKTISRRREKGAVLANQALNR